MEATNLDKIKTKLQKLMRLYEGAKKINSEGEANAAAAAIQRLLTQYNLTMGDVSQEEQERDVVKENIMSCYRFKFIGGDWEFKLMFVICKWNFCKVFRYGKQKDKNMIFFGKEENMETVKWLYNMLCEKFIAFGKNRYKEYQETMDYLVKPIGLDTYLRRYLEGCAAGLDMKFKEESDREKVQNEDKDYGTKVTALVVRTGAEIDTYVAQKFGGYAKGRKQPNAKHDSCFAFGVKDGKNTQIHKGVSESKQAQTSKVKLLK
jgi:hypothetical protein